MNYHHDEAGKAPNDIFLRFGAENENLSRDEVLRRAAGTAGTWFVPKGLYSVKRTITIHSGAKLSFEKGAVVCAANDFSGEALFYAEGFSDIDLCGGRIDGVGRVKHLLLFENGSELKLRDNELSRYTRRAVTLRNVSRFAVTGLLLLPDTKSVDGAAVCGGECGIFRGIRQEGARGLGAMILLYGENAPIHRIRIFDVASLNCRIFIKVVTSDVPVRDIWIRDIAGGCSDGALIMEGIPKERLVFGQRKEAVIEDVRVSLLELFSTERKKRGTKGALIRIKTPAKNFLLTGLSRPGLLDEYPPKPTFRIEGQQKAPVFVSNIGFRQLNELMYCGRILIRAFTPKGFESEIRPGEYLVLPEGSVGYLNFTHISAPAE